MSASDMKYRFDWSLHTSYDYTANFSLRDWAWEFLRRNPEFQMAWWKSQGAFEITFSDSSLTIIRARTNAAALERWGCLYTAAPEIDARTAPVLWLPSHMSAILPMHALPASSQMNVSPHALNNLPCPATLLIAADGVQHVLLRAPGQKIQLAITGANVLEPVHLLVRSEFGSSELRAQIETLCQFNNLIAGGPSPAPTDQDSSRLRQVLRALDGSLAGASHREIAIALFGADRVEADWSDPRQNMRDRIRRAVKRGRDLMNGGYLRFIR